MVNDNTGSTKVRNVTNKVSHKAENKISIEYFMIKVGRNRDPNNEKETPQPIIFKDAQDVSPIDQLIPTGEEDPNPITY